MKMYQSIIFDIQYRYISLIYYQLSTMRLLRKYGEKSHRSIIKVSFLAKKHHFRCSICKRLRIYTIVAFSFIRTFAP